MNGKLSVRGENYHTDHSNYPAPPKATTLLAVALPDQGGDTQFVDVRAAFDDLSPQQQARILPLRSPHVYQSSSSPRKMKALSAEGLAEIPVTSQPLVIRHPDNGRAALYLNTGRMEGIEGMPAEEAQALIQQLFDHATQPKYEYRHQWKAGDMVIWDNRSVMHQANADYDPEQYRFLYRIMVKGTPLQAAAAADQRNLQWSRPWVTSVACLDVWAPGSATRSSRRAAPAAAGARISPSSYDLAHQMSAGRSGPT